MQDTVDQHLRSVQMTPIMQAQFGGTLCTRIICRGLPYRSHKEEDFVQVLASTVPAQPCRAAASAVCVLLSAQLLPLRGRVSCSTKGGLTCMQALGSCRSCWVCPDPKWCAVLVLQPPLCLPGVLALSGDRACSTHT